MEMQIRYVLALMVAVALPHSALADTPVSVSLDPIQHRTASLTVVSPDGTITIYSPAELEKLPTYRIQTTTLWREDPASFDGVMLRDLLEANGLAEVASLKVTAENDFVTSFPRALWDTVPVMIATRADGQPLSRRNRGPIQFIIDSAEFAASDIASERHLVWMAARIEAE